MQIFHAFGAVVGGLGGRVTDALKDTPGRDCGGMSEQFGDERGLVEPTLAFAGGMQGHRDDDIEVPTTKARVAQAFAKPLRDRMPQVALLSVFELMQNFANQTTAPVSGDGAIEMELAMFAIGATERLGDRARKWLGTFRAEGRDDARRALLAIAA
jgi:hypothetical protein